MFCLIYVPFLLCSFVLFLFGVCVLLGVSLLIVTFLCVFFVLLRSCVVKCFFQCPFFVSLLVDASGWSGGRGCWYGDSPLIDCC